jgi:hypothetical protein
MSSSYSYSSSSSTSSVTYEVGGWETTEYTVMMDSEAANVAEHEAGGFPNEVNEDEFYGSAEAKLLISQEIATRAGETRTYTLTLEEADREATLFMFNDNLNWRLDYLGRYILS